VGLVSVSVLGEPLITLDEAIMNEKKGLGGIRLPNPNLDLSRARYLNTSTVRDEELDMVFREKIKDLRVYQDREQQANPA
jgi:hypothetical protein